MKQKQLKEFVVITLGTAIVAASVFFFLMPSGTSVGSISGLAIVLSHFVPLPVSAITMILNVGLLIIGFLFIGKEFGGKTVYTSILLPALIGVLERLFPEQKSIMGAPFLDMVMYVFFVDIGLALLFNANASSGGLDIVAKLLNKFLRMELGTAMTMSGLVAALASIFIADLDIVLLSILGTWLGGIILDKFIFGATVKKRVCIISKKEEEIRQFILRDLHSGATVYEAVGAYNMEPRRELITIVDKNEYLKLMNFIEKTDTEAFLTIYDVNKIIYRPKS